MDIAVSAKYPGDLRVACVHLQSGTTIFTDAPPDRQGKGESFAPIDLCATALAACTMTTVGIYGKNHNVNVAGMEATVSRVMAADPRRIQRIEVIITMPDREYSEKEKISIENAARSCPVRASLHPDMEQLVVFEWAR
jgi:uncharacterized OsmC-like protein